MSQSLADQQAHLLAALVAGAATPSGFDHARLQAAARGLANKRKHAVQDVWPVLTGVLDGRFGDLFDAYGAKHPLPATGNAQLDGCLFGDWLMGQGNFPQQALAERMAFDLRYTVSQHGVLARSGFKLLVRRIGPPCRWLIALRLPGFREFWWEPR